jgi:TM2 domain-containing membrane protein YozV
LLHANLGPFPYNTINLQGQEELKRSDYDMKSRTTAGILGILLGGLGVHKFYLGKVGIGIVYLLFCWTSIPSIIGLIEGILYLTKTDEEFQSKYVTA